jgi:hypothetical protein
LKRIAFSVNPLSKTGVYPEKTASQSKSQKALSFQTESKKAYLAKIMTRFLRLLLQK